MYTGTNPAALRSRDGIVDSCLKLMESNQLEEITIKDIMKESDISRQTFYQIFTSKDEILEYLLDRLFINFIDNMKEVPVTNLCDAAKIFFAFFDRHRQFMQKLIDNNKVYLLRSKCQEYLQDHRYLSFEQYNLTSKEENQFAVCFLIDGLVGILTKWIHEDSDTTMSADHLARLVCRITNSEADSKLSYTLHETTCCRN